MQTSLQNIVQYFSDAAESFVKVQSNILVLTNVKILREDSCPVVLCLNSTCAVYGSIPRYCELNRIPLKYYEFLAFTSFSFGIHHEGTLPFRRIVYGHAENCVKKARLVALQIQMLPTGQQLLNLSKEQVSKFIIKHEKFWEVIFFKIQWDVFETKNVFQHCVALR